ncbi:FliM/FliN family flagellar motor switch protein [Paludibacterium yongneupense]|uniref:FliM/FliN family flagellar motor switch protein n=1 Tax=Paludibacterium yongneupense TaxID=400061 RepID=UPI000400A2E6|nr:FliM/FliN family flagellar motor switch protein [Paludibacterium yongneupense]
MKRIERDAAKGGLLSFAAGRSGDDDGLGLRLALLPGGGQGVELTLELEGATLTAWMDESAWLSWSEELLPLPSLAEAPPDLLPSLAVWTLAPLCEWLARQGVAQPLARKLRPGSVPRDLYWTLSCARAGGELSLLLPGWPPGWIAAVATCLSAPPPAPLVLSLPLVAGWCRLAYAELSRLAVGDAVLLSMAADVAGGELWLFQCQPLARLLFDIRGHCRVVQLSGRDGVDQWSASAGGLGPGALEGLEVCVLAEVGRATLTDPALLQAGAELELETQPLPQLTLTVGGRRLAAGDLIRIGERLAVRIRS